MSAQNIAVAPIARANGWTPERKRLFLETLAAGLPVSRGCACVGLSREAAYKARRRDVDFAQQWRKAQTCALRAAERAFVDSLPDRLRNALLDGAQVRAQGR